MNAEQLRAFWGRDVTIKGMLFLRPCSTPRLIEAQTFCLAGDQEALFRDLPTKRNVAETISDLRKRFKGATVLDFQDHLKTFGESRWH